MARPQKKGLDYFPLDVDFFADRKIRILKSRYGSDGIMIYLYLLCEIYKNGYYIKMDSDYEYLIKDELNLNDNVVSQVMQFLFNRSLLESILVESDTYITSAAIQKRFQEAVKSRKLPVEVMGNLWVLKREETLGCIKVTYNNSKSKINSDKSEINNSKSKINSTKESKVNKSKVKESINTYAPPADKSADSTNNVFISLPLNDKSLHKVLDSDLKHYKELYPSVNVEQELRLMLGWLEDNPKRRKTRSGIKAFIGKWLSKKQNQGGLKSDVNSRDNQQSTDEDEFRRLYKGTTIL